jgi:hypothetical protein
MKWNKRVSGSIYMIRIKGTFNPASFDWMKEARVIRQDNNETQIEIHIIDQAALRGLLEQFWNFNFTVLSVDSLDEKDENI